MAQRRTDEPPAQQGGNSGNNKDTSNLVGVRTAASGSSYEVSLNTPSYGSNNDRQTDHDEYINDAVEARNHIMRITGLDATEAERTREAIARWSGSAYDSIRAVQQGKIQNEEKRIMGNRLERFIERAPKWDGKQTYRGLKLSDKDIAKLRVGDSFDMMGTSSWSSSYDVAKGFALGKAVFVSNTQKHGTSIKFHSGFANEKEILVSKRSQYTIQKIRKTKSGLTVIWLDEK